MTNIKRALAALAVALVSTLAVCPAGSASAAPGAGVTSYVWQNPQTAPALEIGAPVELAALSYASCPNGQSCLYTGANGAGTQRAFAFSAWGPVGTCRNITFYPVGGYKSGVGGFGSGYRFTVYDGPNCSNYIASLADGQHVSSEFISIFSIRIQ